MRNKDAYNKYQKEWREKNPEKVRQYKRKWYFEHGGKEKTRAYQRQKLKDPAFRQKELAKNRRWLQLHPEFRKQDSIRRLKQKKMRLATLILLKGEKCQRCGYNNVHALTFHHVNGGKHHSEDFLGKDFDLSTVQLLCANCHLEAHGWREKRSKIEEIKDITYYIEKARANVSVFKSSNKGKVMERCGECSLRACGSFRQTLTQKGSPPSTPHKYVTKVK